MKANSFLLPDNTGQDTMTKGSYVYPISIAAENKHKKEEKLKQGEKKKEKKQEKKQEMKAKRTQGKGGGSKGGFNCFRG